ncbi:Gut1p [Saccharomyces cerevisiae YJM1342]|nr:Gut1p [Saccharomyces cerevisiae YJM1342]
MFPSLFRLVVFSKRYIFRSSQRLYTSLEQEQSRMSKIMEDLRSDYVPLIASIDVGTTSSRCILFNRWGQDVSKHQIEYSTSASKGKIGVSGLRRPSTAPARETPNASDIKTSGKPIFSAEGYAIQETKFLKIEELDLDFHNEPTLKFPKPGWVECHPQKLLVNVVQCLASSLLSLQTINSERVANGLPPYKVTCMGIANMRETTILWSRRTGKPIVNYGIVWNDTRTIKIVRDKWQNTSVDRQLQLRQKTGLPLLSTYFSCSKLRWFLDNEPLCTKAYEENDLMFGTVDTWLIYQLTKQKAFVSDVTNASRTGFMNLSTLKYDNELLEFWGIDKNLIHMPEIVSSSQYYGDFGIPDWIMEKLHDSPKTVLRDLVKRNLPIQGCLGDQSASMVGQLAYKPGAAKCTYGTGCFLLYNTGTKKLISQHGALTTLAFWFPHLQEYGGQKPELSKPHFALEGSVAVAGAVVQWLRDNLRLIDKSEDVGPIASTVPDSGGVVFVPAFSGLFAPYWDPDARATIMGMSQFTTASHIARAAVEGVCFQARAILKAMSSDAFGEGSKDRDFLEEISDVTYEKSPLSVLAVDGGMSRSNEVMQIQADILGPCVKVRRSPTAECTALGAAIAANMAFKDVNERPLWKDLHDVKKWVFYNGMEKNEQISPEAHPNLKIFRSKSDDAERRKHWKYWEVAVERSKGWLKDIEGEHEQVLENFQ